MLEALLNFALMNIAVTVVAAIVGVLAVVRLATRANGASTQVATFRGYHLPMRPHGWSGSAPASDDEAVARILAAAGTAIDEHGADIGIADIARTLGVTRQTVYRWFASTDALLVAAAEHAAIDFLDRLADHPKGITEPVEALAEAIASALEWLPKDKHIGLLIVPARRMRTPSR